mmetsp:Transcript_110172/g.215975  ORF Transcript_110172/g.215975 Transcript_110172/m.215975 type:complete len:633 (+) Transcript_110172:7-1905(+)
MVFVFSKSVPMLLVILCALISTGSAKKFGTHGFAKYTPQGFEPANEFQMVLPNNIKDARGKTATGTYTINKISPILINNDDVVTVSFTASEPTTGDWIGAYSPPDVDFTQTVPVKYGWCDESLDYVESGVGQMTFNLTNLRADVVFYYFTNATYHPILVAKGSDSVSFVNINQPLRPRVVGTGDLDVFDLLWSSANSTAPTLKWGTESGSMVNVASASTGSIDKSEVCGSPSNSTGWHDLGLIHTAQLVGMKALAGTKIYYVFGDAATDDFSSEHVFFVPPLPGMVVTDSEGTVRPTRAILYDDLGRGSSDSTYTWNEYGRPALLTMESVASYVNAGLVDVIYHGGDISYATGYLAVWDFFMDMISPVAGSVLYLSTVGNHESDWYNTASLYSNGDSGGECGVLTTTLLPMPAPATTNKPWWSYEVGMFHFVGMSTEHEYAIGSEQYRWLENDLKNVDRTVTPWVIFGGHRAMYINSDYGGTETSDITVMDKMILNIEPLLYKYRVNLGFYGHNHVVQRHSAVLRKEVIQASKEVVDANGNIVHWHEDPQATVHMVVGTGGATFTKNALEPPPVWNEMYMYEYGYARMTAVNASYLEWEWVENATGDVHDRMVITQTDPTQPWDAVPASQQQ